MKNIILCGFNWTGCEALRLLTEAGHRVYVYSHEAPSHLPSLVDYARRLGVPCSTENISKVELPFRPDCIASIYYRYIIKQPVIDACQGKIFNLHPSLLPRYRGCSSLTWAMIEGEEYAGYSYHYIDAGCDTGNIIHQQKIPIHPFDNQGTLYQRVGFEAMQAFMPSLAAVLSGKPGSPQVGEPTYFPRGCPHEGEISPDWSDARVERFIRAMIHPPYPAARFESQEVTSWADFEQLRAKLSPSI